VADGDWLARLPVIGSLPPDEAVAKLREAGEDELADSLAAVGEAAPSTFGVLSRLGIGRDRAWLHTAHTVGYLAPVADQASRLLPVRHAASIAAGEDELADAVAGAPGAAPASFGALSRLGIGAGPGVAAHRARGRVSGADSGRGVGVPADPPRREHRPR